MFIATAVSVLCNTPLYLTICTERLFAHTKDAVLPFMSVQGLPDHWCL